MLFNTFTSCLTSCSTCSCSSFTDWISADTLCTRSSNLLMSSCCFAVDSRTLTFSVSVWTWTSSSVVFRLCKDLEIASRDSPCSWTDEIKEFNCRRRSLSLWSVAMLTFWKRSVSIRPAFESEMLWILSSMSFMRSMAIVNLISALLVFSFPVRVCDVSLVLAEPTKQFFISQFTN